MKATTQSRSQKNDPFQISRPDPQRFWDWVRNEDETRTLFLNGAIAEESWFDDDVTPALFRSELDSGKGDVVVWINSPGGDCIAAAQIYNMLMDYKGSVTVKIDGIAASAASVIAMAGTSVLMSPASLMMVHNPLTIAIGDSEEMRKAIAMLDEVKESIINAYEIKTGLSRQNSRISWMPRPGSMPTKRSSMVLQTEFYSKTASRSQALCLRIVTLSADVRLPIHSLPKSIKKDRLKNQANPSPISIKDWN